MYKKGVFTVFALICLSAGTVSYARTERLNGQTVADEPLPEYFGKTDNLSSIIRPKEAPISLRQEKMDKDKNSDKDVKAVMCESTDYCDCTIKISDLLYTAKSGTCQLCTARGSFKYSWRRGKAVSGLDVRFPYALPVAPGTKVKLISDPREKHRSYAVLAEIGEPVFAMRAGVVCSTEDEGSILVYHKDGTFAAYMNVDDRCVLPGDRVKAGDGIGKCGSGRLSISIFYLDKNILSVCNKYPYTHLSPYFRTTDGDVKLSPGTEYVSFIDDELIMKEMSKGQKKRYLKRK